MHFFDLSAYQSSDESRQGPCEYVLRIGVQYSYGFPHVVIAVPQLEVYYSKDCATGESSVSRDIRLFLRHEYKDDVSVVMMRRSTAVVLSG